MDGKTKESAAEKIRRRFTRLAAHVGFRRTKTSFWVRERAETIEFVHLQLFSFTPAFRLHLGIRVLNDPAEAPHLNGPHSDDHRSYDLSFSNVDESLDQCALQLYGFVEDIGIPWFTEWQNLSRLSKGHESPLSPEEQHALSEALHRGLTTARADHSRVLLGVA